MEKGLKGEEEEMPENLLLKATKTQALRYGENPHQAGLFMFIVEKKKKKEKKKRKRKLFFFI